MESEIEGLIATMQTKLSCEHSGILDLLQTEVENEFEAIYSRAWFTRVWILQETLLSQKLELHCAFESIDFRTFSTAIFLLKAARYTLLSKAREGFPPRSFHRALEIVEARAYYKMLSYSFLMVDHQNVPLIHSSTNLAEMVVKTIGTEYMHFLSYTRTGIRLKESRSIMRNPLVTYTETLRRASFSAANVHF